MHQPKQQRRRRAQPGPQRDVELEGADDHQKQSGGEDGEGGEQGHRVSVSGERQGLNLQISR